ncbi:MAG: hypothetical protein HY063_07635 [Bacteroidetes bacterium]|nr:hypothetical protein [Bacteroidota bacterium]
MKYFFAAAGLSLFISFSSAQTIFGFKAGAGVSRISTSSLPSFTVHKDLLRPCVAAGMFYQKRFR